MGNGGGSAGGDGAQEEARESSRKREGKGGGKKGGKGTNWRGVRTRQYTYARHGQDPWMLYDNEKDLTSSTTLFKIRPANRPARNSTICWPVGASELVRRDGLACPDC